MPQLSGQARPPVGIVFDSDMGSRIDTALALALLYGFEGQGRLRVVSLSVSRPTLEAAAYCETVARFYSGAVSGAFGAVGRTLPVGMALSPALPPSAPMLAGPLGRRDAEGKPVYAHGVRELNDTADAAAVIRNAFTAHHDQNAIMLLAGPATNLAAVLRLPGTVDLISRKVRLLVVAGGRFPQGAPESPFSSDLPAARKLLELWPGPIVFAGHELGQAVRFPAASIETGFSYRPDHPVADAYRAFRPMPYDAETWDMAAALYAALGEESGLQLSPAGTVELDAAGGTAFRESPAGRHRYLILPPEQRERVLKTYTEVSSAKPVPKQPRRRKQEDDEEKPAPVKPVPAKPPAN